MHPAFAADLFQPRQFAQRIGMVVDAQIELGPFLVAMDQQRRRLLAALVAAGGLAGMHRRDQPLRERQFGVGDIGFRGVVEHGGAGQHVAGNREAVALDMPAPVDAFAPGMRGDAALGVHDVQLPAFTAAIAGNQGFDDIAGFAPFVQQLDAVDAVIGIDQRLGCDAADAGGDVRHARADGEEFRCDRDAELAGCGIAGDDRPSHLRP